MVKILGISGTPVKDGNCDFLVKDSLAACAELDNVTTEFITLAGKEIALCDHCQWCIENMSKCKVQDDLHPIIDKMVESDGWILGSPTWDNTVAPSLPILFSRLRYFVFFSHELRNKPVGLLTLGFFGFGMDNALSALRDILWTYNTLVVGGARAMVSGLAFGKRPDYLENGVMDHAYGLKLSRDVGIRVVEVARIIKYGQENGIGIPGEYKRTITGGRVRPSKNRVFVDGVWREKS